jgi:hypothetical protein
LFFLYVKLERIKSDDNEEKLKRETQCFSGRWTQGKQNSAETFISLLLPFEGPLWIIVELESPTKSPVIKTGLSRTCTYAVQQIDQSRTYIRDNALFLRDNGWPEIHGECEGVVIIGRRTDAGRHEQRLKLEAKRRERIEIASYDRILERFEENSIPLKYRKLILLVFSRSIHSRSDRLERSSVAQSWLRPLVCKIVREPAIKRSSKTLLISTHVSGTRKHQGYSDVKQAPLRNV